MILAGSVLTVSFGYAAYHWLVVTEQFFRLLSQ